uniref:C-C motif chemokine receptor 8 n=1 Tax=Astyanax mexicanus TaxID=7994 RepID=A0A3B1J592_ASTMX
MSVMSNATIDGVDSFDLHEFFDYADYFYYSYNFSETETVLCAPEDHENNLLSALYCLFFVVGFIGNALVVWVITVGTQMKSMTDVCLLNLALADLLLVLSLPFLAYEFNYGWIFGEDMCSLVLGIYFIGFYGGIFFIVLMSIDRYLAVVHAILALRVRTKTRGIVASLVIWVLAVAASFPELLHIRTMQSTKVTRCIAYPREMLVAIASIKMNIVGLLVPLIIVGFCYSMILRKLYGSHSSKKHSMRLIVVVMVVFFCCWTPHNIAVFIRGLLIMDVIPKNCLFLKQILLTVEITEAVAVSHSCLNPFLYVFVGGKVRRHLLRLFRERRYICCK